MQQRREMNDDRRAPGGSAQAVGIPKLAANDLDPGWQHTVGRLSSRQQQVVVWRYYFDQSVEETATRMGLTPSKVKDATHEATTKLARVIKSEGAGRR